MSELEIGSVKYEALSKWKTLGNKADGVDALLKVLPKYQTLVNEAVNEKTSEKKEEELTVETSATPRNANRPFFTDETGRAMQAVRNMQKAKSTKSISDDYER